MPTVETRRIADQLGRAVRGPAWHGPSMLEALSGLTAAEAAARPLQNAHSPWEIVVHVTAWLEILRRRVNGTAPSIITTEMDWPCVSGNGDDEWRTAVSELERATVRLEAAARELDDSWLDAELPGVDDTWTTYVSLHGATQHVLYHAGQIVLLRKAGRS